MVAYRRLDLADDTPGLSKVASPLDEQVNTQGLATLDNNPATYCDQSSGAPCSNVDVVDYYRETVEDYLRWSPKEHAFRFLAAGNQPARPRWDA